MSLVRLRALLHITSEKLDEKEDDEFLLFHFRFLITTLLSENASDEVLELCLKCLTNLCSSPHRNRLLSDAFPSDGDRLRFVSYLRNLLSSTCRHFAIGLLCNLTRTDLWLNLLVEEGRDRSLSALFSLNEPLTSTVGLILNLSADSHLRKTLCSNETWVKRLITEFDGECDPEKAVLFAGVLKNCCFEDDYHMIFLKDSFGLLEALLLRLCGPEDVVDSDDRQLLPKRVRAVIGTPTARRSNCFKLLTTICQALLQLCATSDGRTLLRARGVYFVLRELHKYEESLSADLNEASKALYNEFVYYLEQVVDQLICEERERDKTAVETSLRNIPIDEQTCAKLDRIMQDCIGSEQLETRVGT